MSVSLPADLTQRLSALLSKFGESVTYTSPDSSITWTVNGSVQAPSQAGLVNDMDQDGMILFLAATDVPSAPIQMGTMLVRGIRRTVEEVVLESPGGIPTTYMLRVRG
jgi:hypothetical protein